MKENRNKFIDLNSVRTDEQMEVMKKIDHEGHCPFCPENLRLYHKRPTIKDGECWLLTENQWPYEHTKLHLIAIHKKHIERLGEISPAAFKELDELFQWVEKEYDVRGGAIAMRFGETKYTGSSVTHLHAHFIQSDIDDPLYETVRFKMGPSKKKPA